MTILNRISRPNFDGDPYEKAIEIIDKIIKDFPDYDEIQLYSIIYMSISDKEEQKIAIFLQDKMYKLLTEELCYVDKPVHKGYYGKMNRLGREVKRAGGHFAFLRLQDESARKTREKGLLEEEKLKHDLESSKFSGGEGIRIQRRSFYIAISGFVLSIATSLVLPTWRSDSIDKSNQNVNDALVTMNSRVDSLSEVIKKLEEELKNSEIDSLRETTIAR